MVLRLSNLTSFVLLLIFVSLCSARVVPLEIKDTDSSSSCDFSEISERVNLHCNLEESKCENQASCLNSIRSLLEKADQCECNSDCLQLIEDATKKSNACQKQPEDLLRLEDFEDLDEMKATKQKKAKKKSKKTKKGNKKDNKKDSKKCKKSLFVFTADPSVNNEDLTSAELETQIKENLAFHFNDFSSELESESSDELVVLENEQEEENEEEESNLASIEEQDQKDKNCEKCCIVNDVYYTTRDFREKARNYKKKTKKNTKKKNDKKKRNGKSFNADLQQLSEREISLYEKVMNEILSLKIDQYNNNLLELHENDQKKKSKKKSKKKTCCPGTRNVYHSFRYV